ncbi:MAG: 16S rRNA (cytosine(967)-C(5))-methyltransferase RsmB [Burkholderiaceae bacterium]
MTAASRAFGRCLAGEYLERALDSELRAATADELAPGSHSAVRDIAYRAVRDYGYARFVGLRLNRRPPPPAVAALQAVVISQLRAGGRNAAVIVDQAVQATRSAGDPALRAAGGFLNATLRRYVNERADLDAAAAADPQAATGHPSWWLDLLRTAYPGRAADPGGTAGAEGKVYPEGGASYPEGGAAHPVGGTAHPGRVADSDRDWRAIVAASLVPGPLTIRVNRRRASAEAVLAKLHDAGLDATVTGREALTLRTAVPVSRLPGFDEGAVTVQDAGAQLAAPLLDVGPGDEVLDACAAPGGKTTHLLQLADCRVLALDIDGTRAGRIRENLARERLPVIDWDTPPSSPDGSRSWGASVQVADAMAPGAWWNGRPFDRILLDAPCSASGVVRRHPDVLWHRRRSDPATFARQQQRLLEALWPLLKPGGKLLYVTCSIFPQEGDTVIHAFCSHREDCERLSIVARWADGDSSLSQLVPASAGQREHDGYFYALLSKQT